MRIHWATYADGSQRPYGLEPGDDETLEALEHEEMLASH